MSEHTSLNNETFVGWCRGLVVSLVHLSADYFKTAAASATTTAGH